MKKTIVLLAMLFVFAGVHAQQHKVVIQMTSADTAVFKALINNLVHLKEGWGNDVQVDNSKNHTKRRDWQNAGPRCAVCGM